MTQAQQPSERRSFSHRTVFVGLVISLICAVGVAVYIYFRYVRYERVAATHVPAGTQVALRIDLEKVVLFEPVRAHVLELINERPTNMPESRLERLRHYTGIELGVDARELVLASGPGAADFEIVVAGLFRSEMFLSGVERMMADEGHPLTRSADGTLLIAPGGLALGQASDRAIVLGSSERTARAALTSSTAYQALGLSRVGPGGFAVTGDALRGWVPAPLRLLLPNLAAVDDVTRVRGDAQLGTDVTLTTLVELRQGSSPDAARRVQDLLAALQAAARLPLGGGPVAAAGNVVSRFAAAPSVDPGTVTLTATWTRDEVDGAAAYLASQLRGVLGLPPNVAAR
jgi:hypothetical protein